MYRHKCMATSMKMITIRFIQIQNLSSDVNLQNIKCVSSNVNVNGVDITKIPQDGTATTAEPNEVPRNL